MFYHQLMSRGADLLLLGAQEQGLNQEGFLPFVKVLVPPVQMPRLVAALPYIWHVPY